MNHTGHRCARPRWPRAGAIGTCLAVALVLLSAVPAFAVNRPVLESSRPRHGAFVRSDSISSLLPITATYDRDLNPLATHMDVRDQGGNYVQGSYELDGPASQTGGQRTVAFKPTQGFSEAGSPYTASVAAYPVGGDPSYDAFTFTIDDTPPAAPVIQDPLNGQIRQDQPLIARGLAEPAATVVIVEGDDPIAFDRANTGGVFAVTLPYPPEDAVSHAISAFALDEAGNKSAQSASVSFVHDSAAANPPTILTPPEGAFLSSAAVVVSGRAEPSVTVKVHENGSLRGQTTSTASGDWSTTISFPAGTHTITATSFDGTSPDGPSPGRTFTVDLSGPPAPVILQPGEGAQLPSSSVTLSGTAEPRATVRIREGGVLRASAPVDAAGSWTVTTHFPDGAHTVTGTTVDAAGNTSAPSGGRTFTVDTAAPATPVITAPANGSSVTSSVVGVSGAAEAGASVRVLEGTVVLATTPVSGSGTWNVGIAFGDGSHTITAVAVDAAGNQSPQSAPSSFTVDTLAPSAPAILEPSEGAILGSAAVTFRGTADRGATVVVSNGSTPLGSAGADAAGVWRVTISLANGPYTVTARARDAAGNLSALSAPRSFVVDAPSDSSAPAPPVIDAPAASSLQPSAVTFTGSAEPLATVLLYEGGEIGSGSADGAGLWRVTVDLPAGPHAVSARARDAGGNLGPPSDARPFTVDAARPSISIATADGAFFLPSDPLVLSGAAGDDHGVARVEVAVYDVFGTLVSAAASTCTGCPGTSVTWTDSRTLAPGRYTVDAYSIDRVGNRSAPARVRIVRL